MTSRPGPHRGLRFPPPPPGVPPIGGTPSGPPPTDRPLTDGPTDNLTDRAAVPLPVVRTSPRATVRRRSQSGPAWVALAVLAAVSSGLAYVVLRGDVGPWWSTVPRGGDSGGHARDTLTKSPPPSATQAPAVTPQAVTPQAVTPQAVTPQAVTPQEGNDPTAAIDTFTEPVRRQFQKRIAAAHAAIRAGDMPAATAALDEAGSMATTDSDAMERLARWRLLLTYADGFRAHRDQALTAAGRGREFALGERVVSVIESRDDELVYRVAGRTERIARDLIPEPLLLAIVEAWYAGAPQPGNALCLGSYHATKARPDLRAAEEHWTRAADAGESSARTLLGILEDPVLRVGSPE